MTQRDGSDTPAPRRRKSQVRKPKSQAAKVREAYSRGVHDGQMAAFTMMAFVTHPELLEELLEGRATALVKALRAIKGHPDESQADEPGS
jgi:hypothetical protein